MSSPKQIAIYGKGGVGKSTITSNLSAALSDLGYNVMQVGCDLKNDSTATLRKEKTVTTVLDTIMKKTGNLENIVYEGYNGIQCIELGSTEPGVGCAGRGIIAAIELLDSNGIIDDNNPDIIIYDIQGDMICGGFAMPITKRIAQQVYTVTSSDYMAVYAANNLFKAILKYSDKGGSLLGGVIGNSIKNTTQKAMITDFTKQTDSEVNSFIPQSSTVTRCELDRKTTIEGAPDSKQAEVYRHLARNIIKNENKLKPRPFYGDDLSQWASTWINRLLIDEKIRRDNLQFDGSGI